MPIRYYTYSLDGGEIGNQDALRVSQNNNLLIASIADGISKSKYSAIASRMSVELFDDKLKLNTDSDLEIVLKEINERLIIESRNYPKLKNMRTTFTGLIIKSDHLKYVHCGDTSIFLINDSGIRQLTKNHNQASEIHGFRERLTRNPELVFSKFILSSFLGSVEIPLIETNSLIINPGDKFLLCTDGLSQLFSLTGLEQLFKSGKYIKDVHLRLSRYLKNSTLIDDASYIIIENQ